MIPPRFRARLEHFLCTHEDSLCETESCVVAAAKTWVAGIQALGFPEDELLLLCLAYQSFVAANAEATQKLATYQTGIAHLVAQNGGEVTLTFDEARELKDGMLMTSVVDQERSTITYRLFETKGLLS